jgi:protein phosphatase PTC7
VLISEVLKEKDSYRWVDPVISKTATVKEAIITTIDGGLSGMIVIDTATTTTSSTDDGDNSSNTVVVGLVTSRDLLRIMSSGFRDGVANDIILDTLTVGEFMTPISQVIYARPDETVGMCRTIMAKLGIKCLPVLSRHGGKVEGIVTARDMSDFGLSATDKGGKQSYLNDISERVGLKADTRMILTSRTNRNISNYNSTNTGTTGTTTSLLNAHLALEQHPLYINVGIGELPHPFKTANGQSGRNRRDINQVHYTDDVSLSEDAYFVTTVQFNDPDTERLPNTTGGSDSVITNKPLTYTYMGVADGVGSWREYGIDPRNFSHALMAECENVVIEAAHAYNSATDNNTPNNNTISSTFSNIFGNRSATINNTTNAIRRKVPILSPAEVMGQAYERVKEDNVIGSTTACIALFDGIRHQLHFSNLGDSGLIVLRHIDSDIAGSLKRDKTKPRLERESDMRVAFVSQQQLRSFNHPYQLGWTGKDIPENEITSFKHPNSACTTSVHVRRGDIVILATDGLFDNVDVEDIAKICLQWEEHNGFIRHGDATQRERRWEMGNSLAVLSMERITDLANELCTVARTNSVNTELDSPFAILAKENDVMWYVFFLYYCNLVCLCCCFFSFITFFLFF